MAKLNDLIWDLYEDDFLELFINPYPTSVEQLAYEAHQEKSTPMFPAMAPSSKTLTAGTPLKKDPIHIH